MDNVAHKRQLQQQQKQQQPQTQKQELHGNGGGSSTKSIMCLLAETILLYFYWTVFTDLLPSIWFIPLDAMSVTDYGEEFYYLAAYLSPLVLASSRVRRFIVAHPALTSSLFTVGITSLLARTLRVRTLLGTLGVGLGLPTFWLSFWLRGGGESSGGRSDQAAWAWVLSLIAFTSSRFAFSTVAPLWWNQYTTLAGVVVGLLMAAMFGFTTGQEKGDAYRPEKSSFMTDCRFGFGFGSLLFLTHWILTAHGVIARWINLDPFPIGIALLFSMVLGLLISKTSFVRSWNWYMIAVVSGPALANLVIPNKIAIIFGLVVVCYLTSVWNVTIMDMSQNARVFPTSLVASLVYLVGLLAVIWSVAYCFVPIGGPFMRERVSQVFCLFLLLVGLAYFKSGTTSSEKSKQKASKFPPTKVLIVLAIIVLCITLPAIVKRSHNWDDRSGFEDMPKDHIRGMAWAIRFGYNNFGFSNFKDVAMLIKKTRANTIVLVETDSTRPFTANRDVVEYLEENLHMYSDYGPSTLNETWGCALFSYFPIIRADREVLPSPVGENACLIDATLDVNGDPIDVIAVHFGNTEHVLDRELQAEDVATRVRAKSLAERKTVWLGYLTDHMYGPNYLKITEAGLVDVSPHIKNRYCIFLFHIGLKPSNFEIIEVGDITDTSIQVADFYVE